MVWDTAKSEKWRNPRYQKGYCSLREICRKKENEGHMKKYKHVFYSVIGNHAGETVEQIINRK